VPQVKVIGFKNKNGFFENHYKNCLTTSVLRTVGTYSQTWIKYLLKVFGINTQVLAKKCIPNKY